MGRKDSTITIETPVKLALSFRALRGNHNVDLLWLRILPVTKSSLRLANQPQLIRHRLPCGDRNVNCPELIQFRISPHLQKKKNIKNKKSEMKKKKNKNVKKKVKKKKKENVHEWDFETSTSSVFFFTSLLRSNIVNWGHFDFPVCP